MMNKEAWGERISIYVRHTVTGGQKKHRPTGQEGGKRDLLNKGKGHVGPGYLIILSVEQVHWWSVLDRKEKKDGSLGRAGKTFGVGGRKF